MIEGQSSKKTCLLGIEELFPFPEEILEQKLKEISAKAEVYWVQEENLNGGSYFFVESRINRVLRNLGVKKEIRYVGRRAIAATAVGSGELHKR